MERQTNIINKWIIQWIRVNTTEKQGNAVWWELGILGSYMQVAKLKRGKPQWDSKIWAKT